MNKIVRIDKKAEKEIKKFPAVAQAKLKAALISLAEYGKLEEPLGKKIDRELFEIRIVFRGQWRIVYAYLAEEYVIILSGFHKKTEKTPLREIHIARTRLAEYRL